MVFRLTRELELIVSSAVLITVAVLVVTVMSVVSSPGSCDAMAALISSMYPSTKVAPGTPSTVGGNMLNVVLIAI